MDDYQIVFVRSARKELEALSASNASRIFRKIEELENNPRPKGSRKLTGEWNLWRIRIGNYRVIYSIDDKRQIVDIIQVRHRKDAYR